MRFMIDLGVFRLPRFACFLFLLIYYLSLCGAIFIQSESPYAQVPVESGIKGQEVGDEEEKWRNLYDEDHLTSLRKSKYQHLDVIAASQIGAILDKEVGHVIYDISGGTGALLEAVISRINLVHFVVFEGSSEYTSLSQRSYLTQYGSIVNSYYMYNLLDEFDYYGDKPGLCQSLGGLETAEILKKIDPYLVSFCTSFTITLSPYMVFLSLNRLCPSVVVLHEESDYKYDFSGFAMELFSLSKIIDHCHPTIYVYNLRAFYSQMTIEYLLKHGYTIDDLFWNLYPYDVDFNGTTTAYVSVDLIAFGTKTKNVQEAINSNGYTKLRPEKYYITEYPELISFLLVDSSLFSAWSPSCPDGGVPSCTQVYVDRQVDYVTLNNRKSFIVLADFANSTFYTEHLLYSPPIKFIINFTELTHGTWPDSFLSTASSVRDVVRNIPALETRTFSFDYKKSPKEISSLSLLYCRDWINDIQAAFIPKDVLVSIFEPEDSKLTKLKKFQDFVNVLETSFWACSKFAFKLAQTLRKTRANVHRATKEFPNSVFPIEDDRNTDRYDPLAKRPFLQDFDASKCFEPIFCRNSMQLSNRLSVWQNPRGGTSEEAGPENSLLMKGSRMSRKFSCSDAKYLVFEPMSDMHGIGSLITQIISALRYSICLNRILIYKLPKMENKYLSKWKMPGCISGAMDCFFEPISHCSLHVTEEEILQAPIIAGGEGWDNPFVNKAKVVILNGLPLKGPCNMCDSDWDNGSREIFDGLNINDAPFVEHRLVDTADGRVRAELISGFKFNGIDHASMQALSGDPLFGDQASDLNHYTSFMDNVKLPWMSFMMRYVMRVRPWFSDVLQEIASATLIGPRNKAVRSIPRPFASMHIRYGAKRLEADLFPLERYMNAMRKHPEIKNIFVSTETEAVIAQLQRSYPDYNFYFLKYDRIEILDFVDSAPNDLLYKQDFPDEFIYSMANLLVSVEADAFVGTLSSNWCILINHLQRTRGDGGENYLSVDGGSSFSTCA